MLLILSLPSPSTNMLFLSLRDMLPCSFHHLYFSVFACPLSPSHPGFSDSQGFFWPFCSHTTASPSLYAQPGNTLDEHFNTVPSWPSLTFWSMIEKSVKRQLLPMTTQHRDTTASPAGLDHIGAPFSVFLHTG